VDRAVQAEERSRTFDAGAPHETSAPWASGELTFYRLYDVGYEIDLARAFHGLASSSPERPRPVRGEAQAIQIPNPPVTVRLGSEPVPVGGDLETIDLSARIFDFGVVSMRGHVSWDSPHSWEKWARLGAQVGTGPEWAACFQRWRDQLIERIRPAIVRPGDAGVVEDYTVFRLQRLQDSEGRSMPLGALSDEHVAALLFGEPRPLAASARRELLSARYSYFDDDLAILAWNGALIIEPVEEDKDVEYVLEFANAQLLELRFYDTVLDHEIPNIYDEIAAARRGFHLIGRRYSRLLARLQGRVADGTELVERVENSLKVTDDVYLARIYAAALEIFRGRTWRSGIDRKVSIVRDAYSMLNAESVERRSEVLEIIIIALIAVELIVAWWRH
jgi:hypothetical protein